MAVVCVCVSASNEMRISDAVRDKRLRDFETFAPKLLQLLQFCMAQGATNSGEGAGVPCAVADLRSRLFVHVWVHVGATQSLRNRHRTKRRQAADKTLTPTQTLKCACLFCGQLSAFAL